MSVVDRNMFSPLGIFFLIVFEIESIVSLLGNVFIIAVIGYGWLQSRKMLTCDFLLITLSISRFLLQWISVSSLAVYFSSPETYELSLEQKAFTFSWMYVNSTSLWCATWLNVFYCVKVANFAHPLFAWLKPRIAVLVPRFLAVSVLAFIIGSIPIMEHYEEKEYHNLTRNHRRACARNLTKTISQHETCGKFEVPVLNYLQFSFTVISVSICLSASILLLLSLWRHMRNLKKSGLGSKDFSTQAHLSVMKPLLLLLFFYILHFVAMIIAMGNIFHYGRLERLISDTVLTSYPFTHTVILIFSNPKLKKAYARIMNLRRASKTEGEGG